MMSIRKWLYKPKKEDPSILAQFFYADEELNLVAAELDSFDGRKDPERCTVLVNQLRQCQDKLLSITNRIMDVVIPRNRASRDFRCKFPDDVLQDNFAGQLWFGAECLAAGSSILNREVESASMRPLAKAVTKSLDSVRYLLREQCLRNPHFYTNRIRESLRVFDRLFAEFELCYVSAIVPVKTAREYDLVQDLVVLFSETTQRALRLSLLTQDMIDDCDPALMFTIPRLAIVHGLLIQPSGPLNLDGPPQNFSDMFCPFINLLRKIRDLLWTLTQSELHVLEQALCRMEAPDSVDINEDTGELESADLLRCRQERPLAAVTSYLEQLYRQRPHCKQLVSDLCGPSVLVPPVVVVDRCGPPPPIRYHSPKQSQHDDTSSSDDEEIVLSMSPKRGCNGLRRRCSDSNLVQQRDPPRSRRSSLPPSVRCLCSPEAGDEINSPAHHTRLLRRRRRKACLRESPAIRAASSISQQWEVASCSSPETSSYDSTCQDDEEIALALQAAEIAARQEARARFQNSRDLIHRLFVCISGVADQLQTNYASDLRNILKAVFDINKTYEEVEGEEGRSENEDAPALQYYDDQDYGSLVSLINGSPPLTPLTVVGEQSPSSMFGTLTPNTLSPDASEERISIDSAEEANERNHPSLAPPPVPEPLPPLPDHHYNALTDNADYEDPPTWVPDEMAPVCMACKMAFTMVRRRHHCRNCGKVFCARCSSNSVPLPRFGLQKPVRVCNRCYTFQSLQLVFDTRSS